MPLGAIIGAGLSLGSQYLLNRNANREQLQQQQALNALSQHSNMAMLNAQQQTQYENWLRTNYSEQVKQLQKAGLNPAMLYGMGGGSGASMGNASGGNFQSQAGKDTERSQLGINMISQVMQAMLLKSQKENLDADTQLKQANAEKLSGVDTDFTKSQINQNVANIKQIESMTQYTDSKTIGQNISNELLNLQKKYEEGTLDSRILNTILENNKLQLEIDKLDAEMPYVAKIANATLNNLKANARKTNADASEREFLNEDYQRMLRTSNLQQQNKNLLLTGKEIQLKGEALEFKNKWLNKYGISPDSSVAGVIAGIVAKYSDYKGDLVKSWETELIRELNQLVNDFSKIQNKLSTGKFPWE